MVIKSLTELEVEDQFTRFRYQDRVFYVHFDDVAEFDSRPFEGKELPLKRIYAQAGHFPYRGTITMARISDPKRLSVLTDAWADGECEKATYGKLTGLSLGY